MKPTHARYWVVVFALALAMIMYIQRVAISQAIVPISADLHLNKAQTGLVLRNSLVFNDTVANNIGCGDPSFTLPQIIEAAKLAHAHQFVPEGGMVS